MQSSTNSKNSAHSTKVDEMDILANARRKIVMRSVKLVEVPPSDFAKPYNYSSGVAASGALGGLGLLIGSHAGIALFGTAISGAWVLAPALGIAGLMVGKPKQEG